MYGRKLKVHDKTVNEKEILRPLYECVNIINNPKVTIGLCVKNERSNVKETINSILNQDFPKETLELIIVDGSSCDKTLEIIKKCLQGANMVVKVFREKKGIGYARQIIVEKARGDYILWIDCGVCLTRDYLQELVMFMDKNQNVGIVKGKVMIRPGKTLVANLENMACAAFFSRYKSKITRPVGTEGCLFRTSAIRQVGGFDVKIINSGEDLDAAFRIKNAGWLICLIDSYFTDESIDNWRALWDKYFKYGYGGHFLWHKNKWINPIVEMLPSSGMLVGFVLSLIAYKMTRRKIAFLLPLEYFYKRIAWLCGFIKAHINGYGHENN